MSSILDAFPYPWSDPAAQRLHIVLANLFPDQSDAVNIASQAGLTQSRINVRQSPALVWVEILNEASKSGMTRSLVQRGHDLIGPRSPECPFLAGLLANQPIVIDREPLGANGAPNFLAGTDEVTVPEALLFHDDLTVPIGRVPELIATLQRLVHLAPAICRLSVDFNGTAAYGTGFRIGQNLLLTNWHVVHDSRSRMRASAVTAEFGYDDDGKGGTLPAKLVQCDVSSVVADETDDWAVISATGQLEESWPIVSLQTTVIPARSDLAYIIQHPSGARKRIGYVRNQVTGVEDRVIHYLTDTQQGSSGSPVFDAQGRLIALHHAGGRPQEHVGVRPVKKNEGIRIDVVAAGLANKNVGLS